MYITEYSYINLLLPTGNLIGLMAGCNILIDLNVSRK